MKGMHQKRERRGRWGRLTVAVLLTMALLAFVSACGIGGGGSGACVFHHDDNSAYWCNDDWDPDECTEDNMAYADSHHPGDSCSDLGYTKSCGSNTHVKPGKSCDPPGL